MKAKIASKSPLIGLTIKKTKPILTKFTTSIKTKIYQPSDVSNCSTYNIKTRKITAKKIFALNISSAMSETALPLDRQNLGKLFVISMSILAKNS